MSHEQTNKTRIKDENEISVTRGIISHRHLT